MAGEKMASRSSPNPTRVRKRVEVDSSPSPPASSVDASAGSSLKRARDGSAFTRCEGCNKDVAVALIGFHNCSLDAKIKLNLEAQVVDMPAEAKKKPTERKKGKTTEQNPKKDKKAKDPNAPKRPQTAFFVFMEEFRKSFMKENPDCKKVSIVAKEGGVKWKSLTGEEKKVYTDKAAELKAEYEKGLESTNHGAENENEDGENEAPDEEEEKQENVEDEE